MIDNFNIFIENLMSDHVNSEEEFWYVQIWQRHKDNPNIGHDRIIKHYVIKDASDLLNKKEEIVKLCEVFNARAYIHLKPINWKSVSADMLRRVTDAFVDGNYKIVSSLFSSAVGSVNKASNYFLVDCDTKDEEELNEITTLINSVRPFDEPKIKCIIPTTSGYHIITKKFDLSSFHYLYRKPIDIHKNNPTLLYMI